MIKYSLYMQKNNNDITIVLFSIIITMQINAIIKKGLNFEKNQNILLTSYYRHIGVKINDMNMIMLASTMTSNINYYK